MKTKEAVAAALVSMVLLASAGCGDRQKEADEGTLAVRETGRIEDSEDSLESGDIFAGRIRPENGAVDREVPETGFQSEAEMVQGTEEAQTAEKRNAEGSPAGQTGAKRETEEQGRTDQARKVEPAETNSSPEMFGKKGELADGSETPVEKETLAASAQESLPVSVPPAETKAPAPVSESPAETEPPVTEPPAPEPVETEPPKPKSIYEQDFDIGAIRRELISIGEGAGLTHVTEDDGIPCTPATCSWASPVTASASFQGERLKQALHDYVASMPSMVTSYGGSQISCFTIYVQDNGGGSYTFYFLY